MKKPDRSAIAKLIERDKRLYRPLLEKIEPETREFHYGRGLTTYRPKKGKST